jgi:guanylate kinase
MARRKVLCIVGASGSGKDTIARLLEKTDVGFKVLVSHTTRPMRPGERNSREHIFHDPTKNIGYDNMDMLAYTQFGGYEYWANFKDLSTTRINVYVIDEKGLSYLREHFSHECNIRVMYIRRPDRTKIDAARKDRDKERTPLTLDDVDVTFVNDCKKNSLPYRIINLEDYLKQIFTDK